MTSSTTPEVCNILFIATPPVKDRATDISDVYKNGEVGHIVSEICSRSSRTDKHLNKEKCSSQYCASVPVMICRLINKLSKAAGLPATTFNPKASSSFVAMSNIENFNNAAKAYGVPTTALFQTPDLYEGRKGPLLNVVNCLNQLGFVVCMFSLYAQTDVLGRIACMHARCYRHAVVWSVCLLFTNVCCSKTDKPVDVSSGIW